MVGRPSTTPPFPRQALPAGPQRCIWRRPMTSAMTHLPQLHAPLVEGVDAPHKARHRHPVLVQRQQLAQREGAQLGQQQAQRGAVTYKDTKGTVLSWYWMWYRGSKQHQRPCGKVTAAGWQAGSRCRQAQRTRQCKEPTGECLVADEVLGDPLRPQLCRVLAQSQRVWLGKEVAHQLIVARHLLTLRRPVSRAETIWGGT